MVNVIREGTGANRGFWEKQLRDRFGKFVEMFSEVMFDVQLPGVDGIVQGLGKFIGNAEPGLARIEVSDNSRIPRGIYLVKSENITAIEAILPDDYVQKAANEAKESSTQLLKEISGDEAKKEIFRYVARVLKEDGRFPVARNSEATARGKNSDIARGAKLAYKKVFDAEPALQEKYKTFENMWEAVFEYSADERTQSPNQLSEIPENMKELNRAYAKHVLGLDPNGLITFYRNAINGKNTEEESAVGYISLDRNMAYDYGSKRDNDQANGRYEVYAKPDEVYGMIGYSEIEDEFGVTIGREVANIPGRVKRVGDLAPIHPEEPWLFEYSDKEFQRGFGSSPFRYFSLISHFNFHPVEPLGDNLQEFLDKYSLTAGDIKAKFDELYGAGAYERYKASGNTVDFNKLKRLFIDVGDGKVALDVPALERFAAISSNPDSDYKDDRLDNHLKILSTLQELTGQPFFTHRTRNYEPPKEKSQTGIFKEYSPENSRAAGEDTRLTDLGFDPEEEITVYRGVPGEAGDQINAGDWVTTLPQLAKDYAGYGGKVLSMKVKLKDLLGTDEDSPENGYPEEMVYRPSEETAEPDNLSESVRRYTDGSGMYSIVNEYLRNGRQGWMSDSEVDEAKKIIQDLTSLIESSEPLEEETIVYRGVKDEGAELIRNLEVGSTITDDGIMSTSTESRVAEGFASDEGIVMRIHLLEGAKAFSPFFYRAGTDVGDPEGELLLAPGTKLKLIEKQRNEYVFDLVMDEGDKPQYEGSEGLADIGDWRKHAIGEQRDRDPEKEPGLKWARDVAVVPVEILKKFMEVDRTKEGSRFEQSPEVIDSIAKDLEEGGYAAIRDPLWIKYDHKNKWGVLVEGNHRLAAAIQAGVTSLPVVITTGSDQSDNKSKGIGSTLNIDNRIVEKTGWMPSDVHPGNFKEFEGYR